MGMMVIVAFLQVIGRFTPFPFSSWFEEILKYSFVWVTMLAGAIAVRRGSHMGVNFLTEFIPKNKQVFVNLWNEIISFIVCSGLAFLSLKLVIKLNHTGLTSASMDIPMWIIMIALPLGFILMTFYSFYRLCREALLLLKLREKGE